MVAAGYVDSAMHGLAGSVSPGGTPWIFSTAVSGFAINLEQAFLAYREAVGLDRRAAEARVRLGRVECVRGSCGSGMRNLRAGGEASADPVVKYYAAMFLGQAEEARGRHDEARLEYERAAALFPTAQSPLLALSALARRTGDGQAADRAAERLWSLPVAGDDRRDPWWEYDAGPRDGPALLKGVYDALAGGLR
jgi:tetratricopeptide (TPR) repeat protein